jgi:hypothetical protein
MNRELNEDEIDYDWHIHLYMMMNLVDGILKHLLLNLLLEMVVE